MVPGVDLFVDEPGNLGVDPKYHIVNINNSCKGDCMGSYVVSTALYRGRCSSHNRRCMVPGVDLFVDEPGNLGVDPKYHIVNINNSCKGDCMGSYVVSTALYRGRCSSHNRRCMVPGVDLFVDEPGNLGVDPKYHIVNITIA